MMAEPTVRLSGIVLSSLMFQHVNSDSDVEGLILGESRSEEQITISDSQADHIHIEEIYHIQKHIVCHKLNHFYDSVGEVNVDTVKKILADNKLESVIGWYRQRRNSDHQMTFREKVVHEKLKTSLSNPHMIFVLLTPSTVTPPGSTHRMEYAAFISRSRRFLKVPVLVNNLGLLEQQAYWKASAPCSAAGYNLAMKKHSSRFFSSNGLLREVTDVNAMNDCLQSQLQEASGQLEEKERLLETLQEEVSALRRKLSQEKKKKSRADKDDDPGDEKNNLLLQEAVRVLFSSPLFNTHTLTLHGFPVPDVSTATLTRSSDTTSAQETLLHPARTDCRKRLRETAAAVGRERKRRKSQSSCEPATIR